MEHEFCPVHTYLPIQYPLLAAHVERPGTYTINSRTVEVPDPDTYVTFTDESYILHKGMAFRAKYDRAPGVR